MILYHRQQCLSLNIRIYIFSLVQRSRSYLADGEKTPSDESIFALLGVDSVVKKNEGGDYRACDVSKSPNSYFLRLKAANKRLGLDTPFL